MGLLFARAPPLSSSTPLRETCRAHARADTLADRERIPFFAIEILRVKSLALNLPRASRLPVSFVFAYVRSLNLINAKFN